MNYCYYLFAGVRPYCCEHCQRHFTTSSERTRHIASVHRKEKTHKCELCHLSFKRADNLKDHMLIHQGE